MKTMRQARTEHRTKPKTSPILAANSDSSSSHHRGSDIRSVARTRSHADGPTQGRTWNGLAPHRSGPGVQVARASGTARARIEWLRLGPRSMRKIVQRGNMHPGPKHLSGESLFPVCVACLIGKQKKPILFKFLNTFLVSLFSRSRGPQVNQSRCRFQFLNQGPPTMER
jgi:hypothetical protein